MMVIIRTLKQWFHGKSRKKTLCMEVKQRYGECIRDCFEPPFSVVLCHEACIKGVAEEYDLTIKKVEKCLNE